MTHSTSVAHAASAGALDRLARSIVVHVLRRTRGGELELVDETGAGRAREPLRFGAPPRLAASPAAAEPQLRARVRVRSPRFYRKLLHGSVGLGESYAEGLWECEDLVSLIRLAARNAPALDRLRRVLAPLLRPLAHLRSLAARNTPARSRRQIAAHYDLGNELFELFLDPTMSYSCAVFEPPSATLEQASLEKVRRVCEKLALRSEHHLLEIGAGWGFLAVYAAERYGCRVTAATLSREQHAYALARVHAAGVQDRVEVLACDYRDVSLLRRRGPYDRLVSIEMIEAVGWRDLRTFLRRCSQLLRPDGAMLLQAILIDDRAYHVEKATRSFINTCIFPGGCLPSLEAITRTLARFTDLREVQLEDITAHYATTLARWRERFLAATDRLAELGYDERFRRLWELYLSYCEGGFRERRIRDVQLLLAKPAFRGEPSLALAAAPGAPPAGSSRISAAAAARATARDRR